MPNYSELIPNATPLAGGLDLASSDLLSPPGSLADCMNVEVLDRNGYKSVNGIVRHDGRISPSAAQEFTVLWLANFPAMHGVMPTAPIVGDAINLGDDLWGTVISLESPQGSPYPPEDNITWMVVYVSGTQYVQISNDWIPSLFPSPTFTLDRTSEDFTATPMYLVQPGMTSIQSVNNAHNIYSGIHTTVSGLPDGRRAHGLHWFRDRLYAVVNMVAYSFTNGNEEIVPNMLLEDSSGNIVRVMGIEVTSGDWDDGTAAGTIWLVDGTVSGSVDLVEETAPDTYTVIESDVLIITGASPADNSSKATLWRTTEQEFVLRGVQTPDGSNDYGWSPVDMGWILQFEDGNYPLDTLPTVDRRRVDGDTSNDPVVTSTDTDSIDFAPQSAGVGTIGPVPPYGTVAGFASWTGVVPDDIEIEDTEYLQCEFTTPASGGVFQNLRQGSPVLDLYDFPGIAANVPVDATIVGIELMVRLYNDINDTLAPSSYQIVVQPTGLPEEATPIAVDIPLSATSNANNQVINIGGPSELFGLSRVTQADLIDVDFGMNLQVAMTTNGPRPAIDRRVRLDEIKIKVYYTTASPRVYFWDGSTDVSALIANSNATAGSFPLGSAEGQIHLYNLEAVSPSTRVHINVGDEMRTQPGGEGDLILVVTENTGVASLPSIPDLVEARSRFQFITANFYANEEWDAIYGVSGAGRAFVYDQTYFRYIYTGLADTLDKPRHIEFFQYHLALGYRSGSLTVSVVGDPENFSGVDGAFEISTGDAITGLLSLPGQMLGVGCLRSIWGLAGSSVQNFELQELKPKEGVIEYTFVDAGLPIYCSNSGISTFSQSPSYGNFIQETMSYPVKSFLRERLYRDASRGVNQQLTGVVCAIPLISKGQYLVFFQDGYCLCMTMVSKEQPPQFTFRRYSVAPPAAPEVPDPNLNYLVPIAHTVQSDSLGRERAFLSHYNMDITLSNSNDNLKYVFEMDKGWSFANNWFPYFFTTNHYYAPEANKSQKDRKLTRKWKLYGKSQGISYLSVKIEGSAESAGAGTWYDCSLPPPINPNVKPLPVLLDFDYNSYNSQTASVAMSGEFFSFTVRNQSPKFENNAERILPPSVSQVILVDYDSAREGV